MKTYPSTQKRELASASVSFGNHHATRKLLPVVAILLFLVSLVPSWAQTVTMRSQPLRLTVPKGVAYSNVATLTITTAALPTPLVNLTVTGVPGSGNAAAF